MANFIIEMEGRSIDLNVLSESEVRSVVYPIAMELEELLNDLSEPVEIVFHIDDEGFLSLRIHGSIIAVNEVRDAIGEQRAISVRAN